MRDLSVLAVSAALALAGCAGADVSGGAPPLSKQQLRHAKYRVVHNGGEPFVLVDGRNDKVPTRVPGKTMSVAMAEPMGFGDLDGDSALDAVVVLVSSLDAGRYVTLAAVQNDGGQPYHAANAELGERTQVSSIVFDEEVVTVEVLPQGAEAVATLRYRFEDGRLILQP